MEMEDMDPPSTSAGVYGKPMETVDYGDEVDYGDYEWFKEPPPRPEVCLRSIYPACVVERVWVLIMSFTFSQPPPAPQPAAEPYVPPPGVIEQNEMFEFALKCAPNVVFARYKQFGQVSTRHFISHLSL